MKKFLLVLGIILVIILGSLTYYISVQTKKASPAETVRFEKGDLKINVVYCRPYKKGRLIFGELVPYGKVWRTGANNVTVFETNKDLSFGDKTLKAGSYSLFTIPGEDTWTVIFNYEYSTFWGLVINWGVGFNGEANRDPAKDAVKVDVPVVSIEKEFEQFTISVEKMGEDHELTFIWDKTVVALPFTIQ